MLELAFDSACEKADRGGEELGIRVEKVASAAISGDCLPQLAAGDDDAASVGAGSNQPGQQ